VIKQTPSFGRIFAMVAFGLSCFGILVFLWLNDALQPARDVLLAVVVVLVALTLQLELERVLFVPVGVPPHREPEEPAAAPPPTEPPPTAPPPTEPPVTECTASASIDDEPLKRNATNFATAIARVAACAATTRSCSALPR
jgi:hypothetical protein